jgi:O-antigen biosynthesis protein
MISVVIVNFKVCDLLDKCITSVYSTDSDIPIEVIVVDNASEDGSEEIITQKYRSVKWIQMTENLGFAKAVNAGIAIASGDLILLVNPDSEIRRGSFSALSDFVKTHGDIGVIGGKIISPDGTFQRQCRRSIPTPSAAFFRLFGLTRFFPGSKFSSRYELLPTDLDSISEIEVVSGALMAFYKTAAQRIGYFDEKYFLFGEDMDFCYRMTRSGLTNYYVPGMSAVHLRGASRACAPYRTLFHTHFAMARFFRKFQAKEYSIVFNCSVYILIWLRYLGLTMLTFLTSGITRR